MINTCSLEWVTDNINVQHFILINSNSRSNDHFYFSFKNIQFSLAPETHFQQLSSLGSYAIFITSLRAHSSGPRGNLMLAGTVLVTPEIDFALCLYQFKFLRFLL